MHAFCEDQEDYQPELCSPEHDVDMMEIHQEAVVFHGSSIMDSLLKEAHSMRQENCLLQQEVELLVQNNEQVTIAVNELSTLKQDSNSIAKRIHERSEALYVRLKDLGERSQQLEETEGPYAAVTRIARSQHTTLSRAFHAIMSDFNQAEENQKEECRARLQRQASILGKEVTGEQLDLLVEGGGEGWGELCHSLQTDGKSSQWALSEIQGRHKELVDLEDRLKEIRDLFLQMAMLVEEQGSMINSIEANVCGTQEYIDRVNVHIKRALEYKRKNPFQQCCACLPCCRPPV